MLSLYTEFRVEERVRVAEREPLTRYHASFCRSDEVPGIGFLIGEGSIATLQPSGPSPELTRVRALTATGTIDSGFFRKRARFKLNRPRDKVRTHRSSIFHPRHVRFIEWAWSISAINLGVIRRHQRHEPWFSGTWQVLRKAHGWGHLIGTIVGVGRIDYGNGPATGTFGGASADLRRGSEPGSGLPSRLVLWYKGRVVEDLTGDGLRSRRRGSTRMKKDLVEAVRRVCQSYEP